MFHIQITFAISTFLPYIYMYQTKICLSFRHRYLSRRHSCANSRVQNPLKISRMGSPWLRLSSNSARMNPTASKNLFKPLPALREPIFSTKSQTHLNRLQFSVRRGDNAVVTVRRATRNVFAPGDPLETESTSPHMHSEVSLRTRQSLSELPGRHQRGRSCADIHFRRSIMEAFCREK